MSTEARALRLAKRSRASADAEEAAKDQPAEKVAKTGETKQTTVAVDDEESKKDKEPTAKPCYQLVIELEAKVAKLEKDYQGVCRIANEYEQGMNQAKQRVEFLENLIDQKPNVNELEKAKENVEKEIKEKTAELQKKVNSLTLHLEAEKSRAKEDRRRDTLRISELMAKQALLESDRNLQKKIIEDMQKKLAEVTKLWESTRIEALRREAELNSRLSSTSEMAIELQRKLSRAYNESHADAEKIIELEQMLAAVEMSLQQSGYQLVTIHPPPSPRHPNHVRMQQSPQLQLALGYGQPDENDGSPPSLAIAEMPELSDQGVS